MKNILFSCLLILAFSYSQLFAQDYTKDFNVTAKLNSNKPSSIIDFEVLISDTANSIRDLIVFEEKTFMHKGRGLWFTKKELTPGNTVNFSIGGLDPDTEYKFSINAYDTIGHNVYSHNIKVKTLAELSSVKKKLLFIIDKDLQNDNDISQVLNQYCDDVKVSDSTFTFNYYYVDDNNYSKISLYNYIKELFKNENLKYLFFITIVRLNRKFDASSS